MSQAFFRICTSIISEAAPQTRQMQGPDFALLRLWKKWLSLRGSEPHNRVLSQASDDIHCGNSRAARDIGALANFLKRSSIFCLSHPIFKIISDSFIERANEDCRI